jgi:signal transduction histidine kinase
MNMAEMEQAIADESIAYIRIAFKNAFLFVLLFSIAVAGLLLVAYSYSRKIKHSISLFTNFFRNAADAKVKIEDTNLAFAEFEDLAHLANRMIDDRIHKEQLLRRDELRLDTLLRLGMMEKHSFQKKYAFILQRIVQITGSTSGYLALINDAQTRMTLCALFPAEEDDSTSEQDLRLVEDSGLPGIAVLQRQAILCNGFPDRQPRSIFPYNTTVYRHLDVPVYNDGKIVVVAGVCNNRRDYDNSDVQQVVRLLEGMWLHVLKIHSEIEMARLERQVIAVSLEERNTIGRDLHDGLGSHLSGVEMLTKVLEKKLEADAPDKAEQLGRIRSLIRDAIDKTRRLAHGLYPVHIIEQGFEASIEEFIVEIESLSPVKCCLSCSIMGEPLDNTVATHVYYIIREAVYNAVRHGLAGNVAITVEKNQRHLFVRIEDNGQGIPDTVHQKGMGLHIMKYRAKAIKAILSIQPGIEKGTVVSLSGEVQE